MCLKHFSFEEIINSFFLLNWEFYATQKERFNNYNKKINLLVNL